MTAPDPTAGEGCGHPNHGATDHACASFLARLLADQRQTWDERHGPETAVAASTGTSEDVEAQRRALEDWLIDNRWALEAYDFSHALMASDWLAAREAAARAEERERIAQAIEADADHRSRVGFGIWGCFSAMTHAARIAREVRP